MLSTDLNQNYRVSHASVLCVTLFFPCKFVQFFKVIPFLHIYTYFNLSLRKKIHFPWKNSVKVSFTKTKIKNVPIFVYVCGKCLNFAINNNSMSFLVVVVERCYMLYNLLFLTVHFSLTNSSVDCSICFSFLITCSIRFVPKVSADI